MNIQEQSLEAHRKGDYLTSKEYLNQLQKEVAVRSRCRFHTWYGRLLIPVRDWLERRCVRYLGRHIKRIRYVNGVRVAVPDEPKTWLGEKVFHMTSKLEFRLRKFLDTRIDNI